MWRPFGGGPTASLERGLTAYGILVRMKPEPEGQAWKPVTSFTVTESLAAAEHRSKAFYLAGGPVRATHNFEPVCDEYSASVFLVAEGAPEGTPPRVLISTDAEDPLSGAEDLAVAAGLYHLTGFAGNCRLHVRLFDRVN